MKALSNRDYMLGNTSKNELLEEVLINPSDYCDELHIISGYATSSMAKRHLEQLDALHKGTGRGVKVHLVIGMIPKDGLSAVEHEGFKAIKSSRRGFNCSYVMVNRPATHAKAYIWLKDGIPQKAYAGSANYSQNAFYGGQVEMMVSMDSSEAESFFQSLSRDTAYCDIDEIEDMVNIVSEREFKKRLRNIEGDIKNSSKDMVTLSLLTEDGSMGKRSHLNWGQRPNRNPNEAYIAIPRTIGRKGFFPPKGTVFTVLTDDAEALHCVTAGNKAADIPKQIETTEDNSKLGRYFRNRLGVPLGRCVQMEDIDRYGRKDVTFVNLGDGTYYMDFSKPPKHETHIESMP
ncbi:MAG: NgoFVII family restriction endonuclease [Methanomassiliicoccaceae archaeon]|nr:NgoFVII family restriction endonuclease [Methanomassiliicoccaceae archaeon]